MKSGAVLAAVLVAQLLVGCGAQLQPAAPGSPGPTRVSAGGTRIEFHVDCDRCDVVYRFSTSYAQQRVEGEWSTSQTAVWRAEDTPELIVTPVGPNGVIRAARIVVGSDVVAESLDPEGQHPGRRIQLVAEGR